MKFIQHNEKIFICILTLLSEHGEKYTRVHSGQLHDSQVTSREKSESKKLKKEFLKTASKLNRMLGMTPIKYLRKIEYDHFLNFKIQNLCLKSASSLMN